MSTIADDLGTDVDNQNSNQWPYRIEPLPLSADTWLKSQGLGSDRQPTLLYLRQRLQSESKTSAVLDLLENYLDNVLVLYATDPSPRFEWPIPPVTFEEAVADAVSVINAD